MGSVSTGQPSQEGQKDSGTPARWSSLIHPRNPFSIVKGLVRVDTGPPSLLRGVKASVWALARTERGGGKIIYACVCVFIYL